MKFLSLVFLLFPIVLFAQQDEQKSISYGANYMGGKVFIHTPKIHVAPPPYTQAIEFSYKKQTTGNKPWQQRFGFPETGLNLTLVNYGSSLVGKAIGFYPSIQFRIISAKNSFWYLKIGGGLGLASKHWKRTPAADSINNIIGSTLNNFTMIQTGIRKKISAKWTMQGGIDFFHISNAATRQPNYGINTIGGFIGVNYHPKGVVMQFDKKELATNKNPLNLVAKSTLAFAEAKTVNGPLYPYYNITLAASKMYRNKSRAMLGIDATYSAELYTQYKNSYNYKGKEKLNAIRYSAFGAHEFVFGKIGLPLQLGFYLNRPAGGRKMYQKLGLNYHFYHNDNNTVKDIFITTQLMTELVNAQYAEFGLGFMF